MMENTDQIQTSNKQNDQQIDIHSYPLPIRIKHPSWSVRKGTYQQILYYLKNISSTNQQILISGSVYTIQTLLPYFQNLAQQKHATVLLKGLQCVQQILIMQRKFSNKHCIKTLVDKGIEYFPLLSQQKKAILQKFLDILELSKIQAAFLKNKLNLPHEKSVMYVIEVIGVLNVTSLKSVLVNLSKKHQKKCVRQLAAQIAQQLQPSTNQLNDRLQESYQKQKPKHSSKSNVGENALKSQSSRLTIQKLPHYEQLPSKKQQEYSNQLVQKIDSIIEEYSLSQLPSFSHVLRLMIDDNNHIVNVNAIKCLIKIFLNERGDSINKNSLIPQSFPLLFIFNKFKSHKTHPINSLLLSLTQAILQSSANRVNDLLLAISQGLNSAGSKANVKFGCALTFFRIISLIHQNEDLYACTTNENIENQNLDLSQKFNLFARVKFTKNQLKIIQKIMANVQKDKKYETQIYLIKYAIGLDTNNLIEQGSLKQLQATKKQSSSKQYESSKTINKNQQVLKMKKSQASLQPNKKSDNMKVKGNLSEKTLGFTKTLKGSKSSQKFVEVNLQETLKSILKCVNEGNTRFTVNKMKTLKGLLQKSSEQFYSCVRERRYEMFYLCELLEGFIESYEPSEETIECVSEYLISLLKIISLLKPVSVDSVQFRQVSRNNVSELLVVGLCRLAISEQVLEVLQNLNVGYGFEIVYESLCDLFVDNKSNKIKKKNKKFLLEWLQSNTPAMILDEQYYKLIECINEKKEEKQKQSMKMQNNYFNNNKKNERQQQRQDVEMWRQKRNKQESKSSLKQPKLKQTLCQNFKEQQLAQNHIQKLSIENNFNLSSYKNDQQSSSYKGNQQSSSYKNDQQSSLSYKGNQQSSSSSKNFQPQFQRNNFELRSSRKRQNPNFYCELQNINLSKIQNNNTQSNYYDQDQMQKSSFHQNLQQQLKQIKTYRTYHQQNFIQPKINSLNQSKEYLKHLKVDNFKKKQNYIHNNSILHSPLKQNDYKERQQDQGQDYQQQVVNIYESKGQLIKLKQQSNYYNQITSEIQNKEIKRKNSLNQQQDQNNHQNYQQGHYIKKFQQVETRRIQREKQRREFMERMKHQYRPIIKKYNQEQQQSHQEQQQSHSEQQQSHQEYQHSHHQQNNYNYKEKDNKNNLSNSNQSLQHENFNNKKQLYSQDQQIQLKYKNQPQKNNSQQSQSSDQYLTKQNLKTNYKQNQPQTQNTNILSKYSAQYSKQQIANQEQSPYFSTSNPQPNIKSSLKIQQSAFKSQKSTPKEKQSTPKKKESTPDSSFISTTSTGDFKYKLLNHQKITYMLKSTTNPYPHLRTLILFPFKSSPKKHQFLKQLLHFFTNQVQFKMPQPYTALTLLTILMFSQVIYFLKKIKEDKSLIQPLQLLYEFVAKQSTTNQFLRTIISLFHTVIEETLVVNRRFLITILLKSMIRMLPFIEDGLGLLRDVQQFYQIGEMVYFEMFEQEYQQIRGCLQGQGVDVIVQKALEQQGGNLKAIVEGWLGTTWKNRVLQSMEEFQINHSDDNHNEHQQQNNGQNQYEQVNQHIQHKQVHQYNYPEKEANHSYQKSQSAHNYQSYI